MMDTRTLSNYRSIHPSLHSSNTQKGRALYSLTRTTALDKAFKVHYAYNALSGHTRR